MGLNWTPSSPARVTETPLTRVPRPQAAKATLAPVPDNFEQLAQRVRAEYMEMPGMSLTREQAQCLWDLDAPVCEQLLEYLVATGFLARTSHATYVRIA
jgi:hypothetical protein